MRSLATLLAVVMIVGLTACSIVPSVGGRMKVTAYLTDSSGVFVGNDVGVLGVSVGKITHIEPQGSRVKVTMEVDKDQPIPATAGAVVVPRSVATDRYIELTPVYTAGAKMKSGAVIPVERTRTPVDFDQVLATIGDLARGIGGKGKTRDAISRLLESQSEALKGKGELINQSIQSLSAAADGVSAQRQNATSTLVALDQLTSTLAANQQTVRTFVEQVSSATAMLADERDNFRTALRSATRMIRVVAQFAEDNRAQITRAVNQTNDITRNVLSRRNQVAEILRVLPLTAQNLRAMLGPGDRLLVRLDLTALLPILGPLLGNICPTLPGNPCTAIGLDPAGLLGVITNLLGGGR
jgi:phospholipid/cholesterol/gamma-HCH transport system substrate-binding protein